VAPKGVSSSAARFFREGVTFLDGNLCRRRGRPIFKTAGRPLPKLLAGMTTTRSPGGFREAALVSAVVAAAALAAATLARRGLSADAFAWAAVQLGLVGIAAYDLAARRIRNAVTVPGSVLAVLLRVAFERSALLGVVIAGLVVFLSFLALSLLTRGAFGMGDVKLAAMLGFILGSTVLPALLIGTIAGGIAAGVVAARGSRRATIAYGPYLALGGAVAILLLHPPGLV
jgi:leader peptidase (prepilin peptidase) / N-methyltransferase